MQSIIKAFFDGSVLIPSEKLNFKPNTHLYVTVNEISDEEYPLKKILDIAEDMNITDLSANHNHYANKKIAE